MEDSRSSGLTLQEVLAAARQRGVEVSERQLKRWRDEELVSSPTKRGLGRGRGTVVFYPAETPQRLVRIARALDENRSFSYVRWVLWCERHPVTDAIREELVAVLGEAANRLQDSLNAFEKGEPNPIDAASEGRPLPGAGPLRRAAGKDDWPLVVRESLSGLLEPPKHEVLGNRMSEAGGELGEALQKIFEQGLKVAGLDGLQTAAEVQTGTRLLEDPEEKAAALVTLFRALQPSDLRNWFARLDDVELTTLRENARSLYEHWHPQSNSEVFPVHYFLLVAASQRIGLDALPLRDLEKLEKLAPFVESIRKFADTGDFW